MQFATLTPLEPRLVRKLLPPLTELIRTTPAMSLLYECINGIIQGGILGSEDDISGQEEIATLCVNKLRGMIMVDGDPNRKSRDSVRDLKLTFNSQIRCVARVQQDRFDTSFSGRATGRCHLGVHRQPRYHYSHQGFGPRPGYG